MNWKRGLFRLWLAMSALWLIIVAVFSYGQVVPPYIEPEVYVLTNDLDFFKFDNVFDSYDQDFKAAHQIEMHFPYNVTVYATNNTPKAVLDAQAKVFAEKYIKPREAELTTARWRSLTRASTIGLLPPLALLLFGLVIGWIVSGFKSTVQKS